MLKSVESVAVWVHSQIEELQTQVFMRPPGTMDEFQKLQGQYAVLYKLRALLKEGSDDQEKQR